MKEIVSERNSKKIELLSFIGACLVAIIHLRWVATNELECAFHIVLRGIIAQVAVPFFFAVSGFFLAAHIGEPNWWRKAVKKRIRSLGVPYIIWLFVGILVIAALPPHRLINWREWGVDLTRYPVHAPLWYLRCLLIFVVLSPLISRIVSIGGKKVLAVLYGAVFLRNLATYWGFLGNPESGGLGGFLSYGFSLEGLFYFSVGLYLRDHYTKLSLVEKSVFVGLTLLAVISNTILTACGVSIPFGSNTITTPLLMASLFLLCPSWRLPHMLSGAAFPIYLMHTIVYCFFWAIPALSNTPLMIQFVAGVFIPIVIYRLLTRYLPGVATVCFGGR